MPGAPLAAVLDSDGLISVFVADPGGGVFTAQGSKQAGWGQWETLSEGATMPGAPLAAVLDSDGLISVFVADPGGGVFTAQGSKQAGWGQWETLSEGATMPGAPLAAVLDGDGLISVFVADPGGGVFTAQGSKQARWGQWEPLSKCLPKGTVPGAPLAAVLDGDGLISVFVADRGGGVFTAQGSKQDGWGLWETLSEGATMPGAPLAAVLDGDGLISVFVADPGGGVFTARGSKQAGWGQWKSLSEGATMPGAPLAAIPDSDGFFLVFLADRDGGIYLARGNEQAGWGPWQNISEGSTTPGAPIAAIAEGSGFFSLFLADPNGSVYTTTNREVPAVPTNLRVTGVGNEFIDLAWDDASYNENGFRVTYKGNHPGGSPIEGTKTVGANETSVSLTGLLSKHAYTITLVAFNAFGISSESNVVHETTTNRPVDVTVELVRQSQAGLYVGEYPSIGPTKPGRVLSISVPGSSEVLALLFLEQDDSAATVEVEQATTTTPQQMEQIFAGGQPPFGAQHVSLRAYLKQSDDTQLPGVQVILSIVFD